MSSLNVNATMPTDGPMPENENARGGATEGIHETENDNDDGLNSKDRIHQNQVNASDFKAEPEPGHVPEGMDAAAKDEYVYICNYIYTDEHGEPLHKSSRYENRAKKKKRFEQWTYEGHGLWTSGTEGCRLVLYGLQRVIASKIVFVTEGEKDAETLKTLGFVGTCGPQGAGSWPGLVAQHDINRHLQGKHVIVIPDCDNAGFSHAHDVCQSLADHAASVRILELPCLKYKGDISDWVELIGDTEKAREMLRHLAETAPRYEHEEEEPKVAKDKEPTREEFVDSSSHSHQSAGQYSGEDNISLLKSRIDFKTVFRDLYPDRYHDHGNCHCPSPDHPDEDESFQIDNGFGFCHSRQCPPPNARPDGKTSQRWSIIDLYMVRHNCSTGDAIKGLAERYGVTLTNNHRTYSADTHEDYDTVASEAAAAFGGFDKEDANAKGTGNMNHGEQERRTDEQTNSTDEGTETRGPGVDWSYGNPNKPGEGEKRQAYSFDESLFSIFEQVTGRHYRLDDIPKSRDLAREALLMELLIGCLDPSKVSRVNDAGTPENVIRIKAPTDADWPYTRNRFISACLSRFENMARRCDESLWSSEQYRTALQIAYREAPHIYRDFRDLQPAWAWTRFWEFEHSETLARLTEERLIADKTSLRPIPISSDEVIEQLQRCPTIASEGAVCEWNGSYYKPLNDQEIRKRIHSVVGPHCKSFDAEEYLRQLKYRLIPSNPDAVNPSHLLSLQNVVIDISGDGNTIEHSPNMLITRQFPVVYDPDAKCPDWTQFLDQIMTKEDQNLLEEFMGYCLTEETRFRKGLIFVGPSGNNGKSVILQVLLSILGEDQGIEMQPAQWTERFMKSQLRDKKVVACLDANTSKFQDSGEIKRMIDGVKALKVDDKYEKVFDIRVFAKFMFACNKIPSANDSTGGWLGRWIILKLLRSFSAAEQDHDLVSRLTQPAQLSGILNHLIVAWKRLRDRGLFLESDCSKEAKAEYATKLAHEREYVLTMLTPDSTGKHTMSSIFRHYQGWCGENGIKNNVRVNRMELRSQIEILLKTKFHDKTAGKMLRLDGYRLVPLEGWAFTDKGKKSA
ncbi:MAG: phage/plasmid primase, P4 family [Pseudomonadota bacterium]